MLKMLMNNPYAWLLLSLCTIASLFFAIYTWIVGKKTKEISIDRYTNEIVKMGIRSIKRLEMKYDGKVIQDLSSTIFFIWNSGNDVINADDMVGENPIRITCKNEQLLAVKIIIQSDKSNAFRISKFNSKDIEIAFDYIDSGEGVQFQILHTGSEDNINVEYKIKGGKAKRDCVELRKKSINRTPIKAFIIDEIIPIVVFVLGMIVAILLFNVLKISIEPLSLSFIVFSVLCGIILLIIFLELKIKFSKIFHRTIPDKLKRGK